MSIDSEMTELADGFRKRFSVSSKLGIDDMIKLVTPPPFPSGINLIKKPIYLKFNAVRNVPQSAAFDVVPPQMSKPITLTLTFQAKLWLSISNGSLILNKANGEELKLRIPDWSSDYTENKTFTHNCTVTIPANTSLANGQFTISFSDAYHSLDTITQIIATY